MSEQLQEQTPEQAALQTACDEFFEVADRIVNFMAMGDCAGGPLSTDEELDHMQNNLEEQSSKKYAALKTAMLEAFRVDTDTEFEDLVAQYVLPDDRFFQNELSPTYDEWLTAFKADVVYQSSKEHTSEQQVLHLAVNEYYAAVHELCLYRRGSYENNLQTLLGNINERYSTLATTLKDVMDQDPSVSFLTWVQIYISPSNDLLEEMEQALGLSFSDWIDQLEDDMDILDAPIMLEEVEELVNGGLQIHLTSTINYKEILAGLRELEKEAPIGQRANKLRQMQLQQAAIKDKNYPELLINTLTYLLHSEDENAFNNLFERLLDENVDKVMTLNSLEKGACSKFLDRFKSDVIKEQQRMLKVALDVVEASTTKEAIISKVLEMTNEVLGGKVDEMDQEQ